MLIFLIWAAHHFETAFTDSMLQAGKYFYQALGYISLFINQKRHLIGGTKYCTAPLGSRITICTEMKCSANDILGHFQFGLHPAMLLLKLFCLQIYVGVITNLIVFPINFLLIYLFRTTRPRYQKESRIKKAVRESNQSSYIDHGKFG